MSELRASACGREQSAVRQSPDADARRIDVGAALQILRAGDDVLILGVAAAFGVRRRAERAAVADAAAIVDRHHDVALRLQPLVVRVRPVIELHVVVRRQHLARRAAVHEHDRRTLLARLEVLRQEELVVNLETVRRVRDHDLRRRRAPPAGNPSSSQRREDDLRRAAGRRARCRSTPAASRRSTAPRAACPTRAASATPRRRRRSRSASACRPTSAPPRCAASRCPWRSCSSRTSCRRARSAVVTNVRSATLSLIKPSVVVSSTGSRLRIRDAHRVVAIPLVVRHLRRRRRRCRPPT